MSEIVCASGVDLLMEYLEGVLPAEVRSELDAHVARCERCAAFVMSYRATPVILRDATASAIPAEVQASLRVFLRGHVTKSPDA
jgi:anti-sigma factor RsiW